MPIMELQNFILKLTDMKCHYCYRFDRRSYEILILIYDIKRFLL